MDNILVILVVLLVSALFYLSARRKPKNFPPGPQPWPVIGNILLFAKKNPHIVFDGLAQKYGSVTGLVFGKKDVIVLNDWVAVKEALVKNGNVFSGRPQPRFKREFATETDTNKGILGADGEVWREQRRFFLSNMRDFGFGKTSSEDTIMYGVQQIVQKIEKTIGQNTNTDTLFNFPIINILWRILAGDDINTAFTEEQCDNILKMLNTEFKAFGKAFFVECIPLMWEIGMARSIMKDISVIRKPMLSMFRKIIASHEESYSEDNIRDYMDMYVQEMRKDNEANRVTTFDNENLLYQMVDVFHAGIDTVSRTLSWSMAYMAKYPDIQKKVQKEIDSVVGNRTVSMDDKLKLVYTEATLLECQRMASTVPLSLFHRVMEDTTLLGYSIPKNTVVIPALYAIHHDPQLWAKPSEFNPERFIEQGKAHKPEYLIPFSIGKRVCPGENLAKMEIYLIFVTLMQTYSVTFSSESQNVNLDDTTFGTVLFAPDHRVVFTKRQ